LRLTSTPPRPATAISEFWYPRSIPTTLELMLLMLVIGTTGRLDSNRNQERARIPATAEKRQAVVGCSVNEAEEAAASR
jgi:hypothetical protein